MQALLKSIALPISEVPDYTDYEILFCNLATQIDPMFYNLTCMPSKNGALTSIALFIAYTISYLTCEKEFDISTCIANLINNQSLPVNPTSKSFVIKM